MSDIVLRELIERIVSRHLNATDLLMLLFESEIKQAALKRWKEEAISVTPPLQEIAREIGVPLGQSIHDKILPWIINAKSEINQARREALEEQAATVIRKFECKGHDKLLANIVQLSSFQQEAPIRNPSESILGNCAHCGSPSPLTCPCVAPIEQETPTKMLGRDALGNGNDHFGVHGRNDFCEQRGCVPVVQQEAMPEGQCPHGYVWGDCAKCPPAVIDMPSPHVAPIPVNEPMCARCEKMFLECQCDRAAAQEAPKPVIQNTSGTEMCRAPFADIYRYVCTLAAGHRGAHEHWRGYKELPEIVAMREQLAVAPTDISGERQREQIRIELQLRVKPNDPIQYHEATLTIGRVHKICDGIHICASTAPQQTTAAQQEEAE